MTITAAGLAGGNNGNNTTSVSRSVGSVTAGQLLVVWGAKFSVGADAYVVGDCTKTAGTATIGSFTLDQNDGGYDGSGTNYEYTGIWSAIVTGSGTITVDIAGAAAGSYLLIAAEAFNGTWDASRVEDVNGALLATDSTSSSTTGNATSAGAALFCAALQLNTTAATSITPTSVTTTVYENETGTDDNGSFTYEIESTGTTQAGSWNHGTTHAGAACSVVVYKEAAGGATATIVTGSATAAVGIAETYTYTLDASPAGTVTVTPTAPVAGSWSPTTVGLTSGNWNTGLTSNFTASASGSGNIASTNDGGLTNDTLAVTVYAVSRPSAVTAGTWTDEAGGSLVVTDINDASDSTGARDVAGASYDPLPFTADTPKTATSQTFYFRGKDIVAGKQARQVIYANDGTTVVATGAWHTMTGSLATYSDVLTPTATAYKGEIQTQQADTFPLSVSSNGRYLQTAGGQPFLFHGDTAWSIVVQLTNAEIDTYLANRAAKGFTAILFNAIEHNFSSQTPFYQNTDGVNPFTTMTDFASLNNTYWNRVDYIVNQALGYGMVCLINPAYLGYAGGTEGWMTEVTAETSGDLQTYGAALATRYTQGNIIWSMGGDFAGDTTQRNQQWNIVTGIRTVRTTDIITAHAQVTASYPSWTGYTGYNLNTAYPSQTGDVGDLCATEYARSGPMPFLMFEAGYENEPGTPITAARVRLQAYQGMLSGACGHFFGNNPIWNFEGNPLFSYPGTWTSNLDSTGSAQMVYVKNLFAAYNWHLLEPKTDTSLVSTSLSSGNTRVCPALASDGTFAMIWIPSSQSVTVVMTAFTISSARARLYDPTAGTYSTVSGSPFANTGTQSIASGGERVLVMDAP